MHSDPDQPRELILVIDDDPINHRILEEILTPRGYEVLGAPDGESGLALVARRLPDLVLLDLVMPGLDGFEVCRRLKASNAERFLPVIIFTNRDESRDKVSGLRAGADDYLTKPYVPEELIARIESMLRIKRLEGTIAAEKRRAEREKEKMERVIASMRDGVITLGPDGRVGLNPSAALSLAPHLAEKECDYRALCRLLSFDPLRTLEENGDDHPQVREITIGDDVYGAITSSYPSSGGAGKDGGAVLVLRNMTKEKALDRMKTEFISFVSHELRTPLTSVKNSLALMRSGKTGPLPPDTGKFLDIANRNATRLATLIDDLLDLSRIEAGRIEMKFVPATVDRAIDASVTCLVSQADAKRIAVAREVPGDLPLAFMDLKKIEQVITNLVGNAIKFTPAGGTITVRAGMVKGLPPLAPKPAVPAETYVQVSVEDNGIGIPLDHIEKIFDRFHQVRGPSANAGTGLGLAIVKNLVEAHGGVVWVESEAKRWSRFTFVLPLFGEEAHYQFNLHAALERARRAHEVLSIVAIRIEGGVAARAEGGAGRLDEVFRRATAATEKTLYKSKDTAFPLPARGELRVILPGTPKNGAFAVLRRLGEAMRGIPRAAGEGQPEVGFGVITYPDDGIGAPELEHALAENTGPVRVGGDALGPGEDPFALL